MNVKRRESGVGPAAVGSGAQVREPAELGALVRRVRQEQGLTLEGLYEVTGLTTRFLSEFERGKANPSLGRAMQALDALGLTMLILSREQAEQVQSKLHSRSGSSGAGWNE